MMLMQAFSWPMPEKVFLDFFKQVDKILAEEVPPPFAEFPNSGDRIPGTVYLTPLFSRILIW
jgi:hypothetical protein